MKGKNDDGWYLRCDGCGKEPAGVPAGGRRLGDLLAHASRLGWTLKSQDHCPRCSKAKK